MLVLTAFIVSKNASNQWSVTFAKKVSSVGPGLLQQWYVAVMESQDLVSVLSSLGLEGFHSRALSLKTFHEVFFLWSIARSSSL